MSQNKNKIPRLPLLLLLAVFALGQSAAWAATFTAAATGDWNAGATWGNAGNVVGTDYPGSADTAVINNAGFTVTVNATTEACAVLTITAGTLQNNGTLTVSGNCTGAGTLTQGVNATLNCGGATTSALAVTTVNASATGNTVNFNRANAQTLPAITYYHLTLSGSGVKSGLNNGTTLAVKGNLTLLGTATATTGSTGLNTVGGDITVGDGVNTASLTLADSHVKNFKGNVTVSGGSSSFTIGGNSAACHIYGTTTVGSGCTLTKNQGTPGDWTFDGDVSVSGTLSESSAYNLVFGGNVTINSGGTLTETGAATMSCAGNLQNSGTYTASTGVHTFSGTSKTLAGTLAIPSVTVTGTYGITGTLGVSTALVLTSGGLTSAGNLTLGNGATITRKAGSLDAAPTFSGTVNVTYNNTAAGTTTGPELPTSSSVLNNLTVSASGQTVTLNAVATVNAALAVTAGTLLSSGASPVTVTGTTTVGGGTSGTLSIAAPLGSGLVVLNGGTLTGTAAGLVLPNAINLQTNSTVSVASGLDLTLGGIITNAFGLTKSGGGTLLLNNANTFTGPVTLSGGSAGNTLVISSIDNVANANPLGQSSAAAANLLLANNTTLKYVGGTASTDRSFTLNHVNDFSSIFLDASGAGPVSFTSTSSPGFGTPNKSCTLFLTGTNTDNNTLAALLADNGTGVLSLTKSGTGTWVLTGANTYTGNTTVSNGMLVLGASGALSAGSPTVKLGNATLDAGTFANTSGALDVTGAGTINLGSGGTLAFANSSAKTWNTGAGTLTVTGPFVPGASLRFGTTSGGLTGTQLGQISISGYDSIGLDSSGYLTATIISGGLATTNTVTTSASPVPYSTAVIFTSTVQTNAPLGVAATAGSNVVFSVDGTPVATNPVVSGVAYYTNNTLTVSGSPHTIQALYLGDGIYSASSNTVSQTITQFQPVQQTAPSASSITYGQSLSDSVVTGGAFTNLWGPGNGVAMSSTNFVTPGLVPNAGTTNVAVYFVPVDTANYLNVTSTVTVTVLQASNTLVLTAAPGNTVGYKDSVTYTATVQTNGATAADATGPVVFYYSSYGTNAAVAFSTNAAVAGVASSVTISNQLPRGTNLITAEYATFGNYLGWTNSLIQTVTNHPAVAGNYTNTYPVGTSVSIRLTNLTALNIVKDADGDALTLVSAGTGTNSGTIIAVDTNLFGGVISFTNANHQNDHFSYTVTDGYASSTGTIYMVVGSVFGQGSPAITPFGSTNLVTFYGIPGYTYSVWRDSNVNGAYTNVGTISSPNGVMIYTDSVPLVPNGFYKLSYP